jgi:hypothetical protein
LEVFPRPFFRDLTFIGRSTEHRERHFGPLKRDCNFLHIAHGVVGQEALAYYHSAPIGLNIHAEPELSWEPRVQQLMACGPLAVSEPISPNNVFNPGEHFVQTNDPNQTYQICREISAQRAKYEAMRVVCCVHRSADHPLLQRVEARFDGLDKVGVAVCLHLPQVEEGAPPSRDRQVEAVRRHLIVVEPEQVRWSPRSKAGRGKSRSMQRSNRRDQTWHAESSSRTF